MELCEDWLAADAESGIFNWVGTDDFFLFPKLKEVMKGHHLGTIMGIKADSLHMLKEIPAKYYQECFHVWKQHMHKCISGSEDCFEENALMLLKIKIKYFFNCMVAHFFYQTLCVVNQVFLTKSCYFRQKCSNC